LHRIGIFKGMDENNSVRNPIPKRYMTFIYQRR
jgi:hypothetical protein